MAQLGLLPAAPHPPAAPAQGPAEPLAPLPLFMVPVEPLPPGFLQGMQAPQLAPAPEPQPAQPAGQEQLQTVQVPADQPAAQEQLLQPAAQPAEPAEQPLQQAQVLPAQPQQPALPVFVLGGLPGAAGGADDVEAEEAYQSYLAALAAAPRSLLPTGPLLHNLTWLAAEWELLAASRDLLGATTQLERLHISQAGLAGKGAGPGGMDVQPWFWPWAASLPCLRALSYDLQGSTRSASALRLRGETPVELQPRLAALQCSRPRLVVVCQHLEDVCCDMVDDGSGRRCIHAPEPLSAAFRG
ncbi:hypothetical protein ABPG75_002059 [Micractinium tetrahymenae]